MRSIVPTGRHEAFRDVLLAELRRAFAELRRAFADLPAEEMLAVTCQIVGQMIAFQDQRRFTPQAVMNMVEANIEKGNQDAIASLMAAPAAGHA